MKKVISKLLVLGVACCISTQSIYALTLTPNEEQSIYESVQDYVDNVYINLDNNSKQLLIDDLYQERLDGILNSSDYKTTSLDVNSEIDLAYQNMMDEENYIVDFINQLSEENTTLSNWEFNLNCLQENYDEISNIPEANLRYIDSYIEAYTSVLDSKDMPDEKVNEATVYASSYNSTDAVNYANEYYKNYNSNYPDWNSQGGDCANFVSQCLYAGGKTMKGTPGTSSSAQNFTNWFSKGTAASTTNVSSTWRGADAFRNYWQDNASSYKKFTAVDKTSYSYGWSGDAVSLLNSNGRAYHTMIIVGYDPPDFVLAVHTGSTNSALLSDKITSNGFIIYNMK